MPGTRPGMTSGARESLYRPSHRNNVQLFDNPNGTASLHLTLAVCDYEHVREIAQGIVRADGITLTPLIFPSIEEITYRFTKSLEWDVSELSFGKYISLTSQGIAPMVAIPVFPSRVHRHSAIYVRGEAGIKTAKDLEGRAVGV